MKKSLLLSALSCFLTVPAFAQSPTAVSDVVVQSPSAVAVHKVSSSGWGYVGGNGPQRWGDLNSAYETCKAGKQQSPVNIDKYVQGDLSPFSASYEDNTLEVLNTGHTVRVNYPAGGGFTMNGKQYTLKEFEFHTPSEHYIDGAPYPMEAHFLHVADDGSKAIVAVMFKIGAHNPVVEGIWQNVPQEGHTKTVENVSFNAAALMPAGKGYYTYMGSLTTPPCSEGVRWFVLKDPAELSESQLRAFQSVFPVNARPVQPIGERVVQGN